MQKCARNTENASILVKRHAESELRLAEICRCLWGDESRNRIELGGGEKKYPNSLKIPKFRCQTHVCCAAFLKMTAGCFVIGKYNISPVPWDEVWVLTEGGEISVQK